GIRGPHFQKDAVGHVPAREVDQAAQYPPAVTVALVFGRDADVEHMRFVRGTTQHAVADQPGTRFEHPALMADTQAVAEDSGGPRKRIGALLDRDHRL